MYKSIVIIVVLSASASGASFSMEDYLKAKPKSADKLVKIEKPVADFPAGIIVKTAEIAKYEQERVDAMAEIAELSNSISLNGALDTEIKRLEATRDKYKEKEDSYRLKMQNSNYPSTADGWKSYVEKRKEKDVEISALMLEIKAVKRKIWRLESDIKSLDKKIENAQKKIVIYKRKIKEMESE